MPKLPGINHLNAVRALEKAGFRIARQGKHIVMTDGIRTVTIPRNNPVNAYTMAKIVRDKRCWSDNSRILQVAMNKRSHCRDVYFSWI